MSKFVFKAIQPKFVPTGLASPKFVLRAIQPKFVPRAIQPKFVAGPIQPKFVAKAIQPKLGYPAQGLSSPSLWLRLSSPS